MKGSLEEIAFMKFCESLGIEFIDVSEEANEDKNKIEITDLCFGYKNYAMSYTSGENRELETCNLFQSSRVLRSVAMWVLMSDEEKEKHDALFWCFSDVWGRSEYEFVVSPWGGGGKPQKIDIYQMYVEPNKELLLDLVSRVTPNSAKEYLREERKRYRR